MIQNKFFERAIANLKKQVSVPDAGRGNFNVFRGEMPTANFALRDQLAQQGQVQQQQNAEQQSQFSAIAQNLGKMAKKGEVSLDPNSDVPLAPHGPGGTSWSGEPIPRTSENTSAREDMEMASASKVNPALTTPSGGQPIDVAKVGRDVQGMPIDGAPIHQGMTASEKYGQTVEPQAESGDGQMVGNQPFNKQYSQEEVDVVINPPMSPAEKKLKEIREIEARDYKKGGKDYDKKHDWKDALRSAGLGALEALANADVRNGVGGMVGAAIGGAGGGAIGGTFDRHFDNKIQDKNKLKQLYPAYERLFETEKGINDEKRKKDSAESILRDRESDNKRQDANLQRQIQRDEVKAQLDQDKLDFNVETASKIQVWRERKLDADIKGDAVKAELAQKRIDELIRSNKAREDFNNTKETNKGVRDAQKAVETENQIRLRALMQREAEDVKAGRKNAETLKKMQDAYERDSPWNATGQAIPN